LKEKVARNLKECVYLHEVKKMCSYHKNFILMFFSKTNVCFGVICLFCFTKIAFAQKTTVQIAELETAYHKTIEETKKVPILHRLVELYLDVNKDSAKAYAERAYKITKNTPQTTAHGRSYLFMGLTTMKTLLPDQNAKKYFEEARAIAEKVQDKILLGEVYLKFAEFCAYKGNIEEAINFCQKSIAYYQTTSEKEALQNAYHRLGTFYSQQGKPQKSLDAYFAALKLLREKKREDIMGILSDIGNVYFNQGNFIEALSYYKQALQVSKTQQDFFAQGFCLNNIGLVHNSLGNHDEALDFHLQALKMREIAKTEEGISNSYNSIGRTYNYLGYPERGRLYIKKALEIDKKLGNKQAIAQATEFMATLLVNEKKYTEALGLFEEASKIKKDMGQILPMGINYNYIGNVYFRQRNFEKSIYYFTKADSLFQKAEAQDFATTTYIYLAKIYFEMAQYAKSKEFAHKALRSALKRKTKNEIVDASQILAQIHAQQGEYAQAYPFQQQALAYKDSLNVEEKNRRLLRMQAIFEFKQQESEIKEKEKENKKLKDDKNYTVRLQYVIVGVFSLLLLVLGGFAYFLWRNKRFNELKKQQLAQQNEEIMRQSTEINIQKEAIEKQNTELQNAHKKLSEANQELIDSINYAHRIQKAVLPTHEEIAKVLPNHFILYKPRNVVSGDFYWFSDKEKHTVMAVMDCTGHGIPGAFMSLIGNDILHEIVNLREILDPAQILTELKRRVNAVLKQHTTKGRDGMDIAICVIDHLPTEPDAERNLYFASAHLTMLYFQERELLELEGSKIYIGGYDPDDTERNFETKVLKLDKVTTCYLFSDGYQDQFGEGGKKKFTKKRLKNTIKDIHLLPPTLQSEILEETIDEWKGEGEQTDDIIIFGLNVG
jgi:tetratricopeptide (TPR) repeat protein